LRHTAALRNSSNKRSNSGSSSRNQSANKSGSFAAVGNGNGAVNNDKKYCVFTTKDKSNIVVACENPVPGKLINESLVD
jgi:hypothetical protein